MNRLSISFILSIILHVTAVAAITTMQLLQKPEKKKTKIMFIKPVKLSELRTLKPVPAKPKTLNKKIAKPKLVEKKSIIKPKLQKLASKPLPSPTPYPVATPLPIEKTPVPLKKVPVKHVVKKPVKVPVKRPLKKPLKKLTPLQEKVEKEQKAKVAFLRKQPYFKNWPEARIRRLELPPGIKSWEEAAKLTEYFDKEYNWTMAPPDLGSEKDRKLDHNPDVNPYEASPGPAASTVPNPDGTPIPWKLYRDDKAAKTYDVRFYKNNTGFIGTFKEAEKVVVVSYFPFDPDKAKKSATDTDKEPGIEVAVPDNVKPEQVKHFNLPLTQEDFQYKDDPEKDLQNKEQIVKDIIKQYELLER